MNVIVLIVEAIMNMNKPKNSSKKTTNNNTIGKFKNIGVQKLREILTKTGYKEDVSKLKKNEIEKILESMNLSSEFLEEMTGKHNELTL